MMRFILIWFIILEFIHGLKNGRGITPTMGWDTVGAFGCDLSEPRVRQMVDMMESTGLRDVGYVTFILGCGWQGTSRDKNGVFQINSEAFPGGMDGMARYVHDKKMQFGLTSSAGAHACGTRRKAKHKFLGEQGFESPDIHLFANWGIDFLKLEYCWGDGPHTPLDYNPKDQIKEKFKLSRDALSDVHPITYEISAWGIQDPLSWPVKDYANLWRLGNDVAGDTDTWSRIIRAINQFAALSWANEPGTFADLDLLQVGQPGLSVAETITQFTFWAAAKSPLILSTNLNVLNPTMIEHFKKKEIIAVNQDPLGASARLRRRYTDLLDVWSGPMKDGSVVVVIVNFVPDALEITFNLADVGLLSANILDLWSDDDYGQRNTSIPFQMAGHGVQLLKLTSMTKMPPISYQHYPAIGPNCDLFGSGAPRTTGKGLKVAGNIGKGSYIQWHDIDGGDHGGRKYVTIDFIMADSEFFVKSDCPRCREGWISINGGPEIKLNFPSSGNTWDDVYFGYLIELDGFVPGPANKIKITNGGALTPDFVSLGVQADVVAQPPG